MKHYAISRKNISIKDQWIKHLLIGKPPAGLEKFENRRGLLYSEFTLNKFIEEDYRHGNSILTKGTKRSFQTLSSGEKRKALLHYLLSQNPDFLVLDNPFESLDKASVRELQQNLNQISEEIPIIQLFNRREDILGFIDSILEIEKEEIVSEKKVAQFLKNSENEKNIPVAKIPQPLSRFREVPEILFHLKNVSVKYEERPILSNINWTLKKGEFWQLKGPNGSGKTTLLSMLYGDNPKAYGQEIYLFGNKKGSGESVWEIKQKIGYFSQGLTQLFTRRDTVLNMLISGLVDSVGLYKHPGDSQVRLAREWLKTLKLQTKEKQIFTKLPLAEQRLVLIARAMIKHPPLLILDEPTTSVDDAGALRISAFINQIAAESETAVIFVSHRDEKGLKPDKVFELLPQEEGSIGKEI